VFTVRKNPPCVHGWLRNRSLALAVLILAGRHYALYGLRPTMMRSGLEASEKGSCW